jgi:adenine deaminase
MANFIISGNIIDIPNREIYPGTIEVREGKIAQINRVGDTPQNGKDYILPGFIDSHIHIESSMLTPAEFGRAAALHGTVAAVSDPHEIANVLGVDGVKYMVKCSISSPIKFLFGAPSCVPATTFETSGAILGIKEIEALLEYEEIGYLAEMMNFPGVINKDPVVMGKLATAKINGKPIDGHAPGLTGANLEAYANAGIETDHECFILAEAEEKLALGMKILIREGSAAKNFEELASLIDSHPGRCMLCSDDLHPDDLLKGHINLLVKMAIAKGLDLFNVLQAACITPISHYAIDVGMLREGDPADLIVVDNLKDFNVKRCIIGGTVAAENGEPTMRHSVPEIVNNFKASIKMPSDFRVQCPGGKVRVIEAIEGQLVTRQLLAEPRVADGCAVSAPQRDILKITVVNRYSNSSPAIGFIKGFGLRRGAIASSVAHDSHNIIAVGTNDEELCQAVNLVIEGDGGISAVEGENRLVLSLPIAGIISDLDYAEVASRYTQLDSMTKKMGTQLRAPYMTLSFMALLVIPELKLSDRGLFDGNKFQFVELFTE